MKISYTVCTAAALCFAASCTPPAASGDRSDPKSNSEAALPDTVTLALDWSPNVLHSGIFLAAYRGWYRDEGIHLNWFTTEIDGYRKKPVQRLADGEVDLAIGPSEHLFFFRKNGMNNPVAVASVLQKDKSAFCMKAEEGLSGPGDLAGHTYIGYNTPLEQAILTAMMREDGLDKAPEMRTPGRLEVWEDFMNTEKGIAWIFTHWEGILAENSGTALTCFTPADYGVPYGYSSVLMARENPNNEEEALLKKFLKVTERGYRAVADLPADTTAAILGAAVDHPNFADHGFSARAAERIRDGFLRTDGSWGRTDPAQWEAYLNWIRTEVKDEIPDSLYPAEVYFTNRFLDQGL